MHLGLDSSATPGTHSPGLLAHGDEEKFKTLLDFPTIQSPLALQIGGMCENNMRDGVARLNSLLGPKHYDELNINCGCPSPRVSGSGCFGAALMRTPEHVAHLANAAHDASGGRIPVTVKCRLGLINTVEDRPLALAQRGHSDRQASDDRDFDSVSSFVRCVSENSCVKHFIVHARCADITGQLDPKENRSIPPLKPHLVHRLVAEFPRLTFGLNGGLRDYPSAVASHLLAPSDECGQDYSTEMSETDTPSSYPQVHIKMNKSTKKNNFFFF